VQGVVIPLRNISFKKKFVHNFSVTILEFNTYILSVGMKYTNC
jgi:hypothetical protein